MLSQVGCITLPAETLSKVYGGQPLSEEEAQAVRVASGSRRQVVRSDPAPRGRRRNGVGPAADTGQGNRERRFRQHEPAALGAAILWTAVRFDQLVNQGSSPQAAAQQIRALVPHLPPAITEAMVKAPVAAGGHRESRSVTLNDLAVGMVLEDEVLVAKGIRLVPKGVEITDSLLGRLRTIASGVRVAEPIRVSVLVRE